MLNLLLYFYCIWMPWSIEERVRELRQEIAELSKRSSYFLRGGRKDATGLAEQQRRIQRVLKIKEELMSLTAWKKV